MSNEKRCRVLPGADGRRFFHHNDGITAWVIITAIVLAGLVALMGYFSHQRTEDLKWKQQTVEQGCAEWAIEDHEKVWRWVDNE